MTSQTELTEIVQAVMCAISMQSLIDIAVGIDSELAALLDNAVMTNQVNNFQGLSGLVWMTTAEHKVH